MYRNGSTGVFWIMLAQRPFLARYTLPSPTKWMGYPSLESARSDTRTGKYESDGFCAAIVTVPIPGNEYVPAKASRFSEPSSAYRVARALRGRGLP